MDTKVAVVTGANRGIGFAIVRGLCKRFDGVVYLTSRNIQRGQYAVAELEKEGLHPKYHQLDITDGRSVLALRDHIRRTYGGIDVLVNNAAVAFKTNAPEPLAYQAEATLYVNFFSLMSSCDILFPILKNGARVINMSSSAGHLSSIPNAGIRFCLAQDSLTLPELTSMMLHYVDAVKDGVHEITWGNNCYAVSKVAVTGLTRIQQGIVDVQQRDIKVNAVHPGYVSTEMTSYLGTMTIDQGAEAPLYLALDAPDSIKGQFVWFDKTIVTWDGLKPHESY